MVFGRGEFRSSGYMDPTQPGYVHPEAKPMGIYKHPEDYVTAEKRDVKSMKRFKEYLAQQAVQNEVQPQESIEDNKGE
jgi:hypothetical protein